MTHAEHARELPLIRICNAADQDINGRCFNCGWFPQRVRHITMAEAEQRALASRVCVRCLQPLPADATEPRHKVCPNECLDVPPLRCGAYVESWKELGQPNDWLGCAQESGHKGNHGNIVTCGYSVMVSPEPGVSSQWRACTKPLGHEGLHMEFRSH